MSIENRVAIIVTAAFLGLAAQPALAWGGYGSAASTAYTLGATASPGLQSGPVPTPPVFAAPPHDVTTTGSIGRHAPHFPTRSYRR